MTIWNYLFQVATLCAFMAVLAGLTWLLGQMGS